MQITQIYGYKVNSVLKSHSPQMSKIPLHRIPIDRGSMGVRKHHFGYYVLLTTGFGIGDHCPIFIEVNSAILVEGNPVNIVNSNGRRLQIWIPMVRGK